MPRYSKKQVVDAGKLIAEKRSDVTPELVEAFKLAHGWRGAHLRPMRRVRAELMYAARKVEPASIVAARLKRLQSIRRKMQRRPMTLFQMQDVAGVRAIMRDMDGVERVLAHYREGRTKFEVGREWDYIAEPKRLGYRSAHLRISCPALDDDEVYSHLNVEVQVRTRLQHAWATAVEAVGLVRREELKSGQGNPKWLRLFELMSSEIALREKCPVVPGTGGNTKERIEELKDLAYELEAITTLENYNQALKAAEQVQIQPGAIYIITYDYKSQKVHVNTYSRFSKMYAQYFLNEISDQNTDRLNVVSVEVDRVEDLKAAYPNYFMDVRSFTNHLKRAVLPPVGSGPTAPSLSKKERKWADIAFLREWIDGSTRQ